MKVRHTMYGFPEIVLEPGTEIESKIDVSGVFRASKIVMLGMWDVIRGRYKIKRSRLPLLDRDVDIVNAYTRVYKCRRGRKRWFRPGKTTVLFKHPVTDKLVTRDYLPSSVVYITTDPLEYVHLRNLNIGKEPQMSDGGALALMFSQSSFGNGLSLPSTELSVTLVLKSVGDVQIRVRASIFGMQYEKPAPGTPPMMPKSSTG